jgi:hypothetical protein
MEQKQGAEAGSRSREQKQGAEAGSRSREHRQGSTTGGNKFDYATCRCMGLDVTFAKIRG